MGRGRGGLPERQSRSGGSRSLAGERGRREEGTVGMGFLLEEDRDWERE